MRKYPLRSGPCSGPPHTCLWIQNRNAAPGRRGVKSCSHRCMRLYRNMDEVGHPYLRDMSRMLREVGVRKLRDNQHLLSAMVADLCAKKKRRRHGPGASVLRTTYSSLNQSVRFGELDVPQGAPGGAARTQVHIVGFACRTGIGQTTGCVRAAVIDQPRFCAWKNSYSSCLIVMVCMGRHWSPLQSISTL